MPTINDVASLAGVSATTAKRVLREPERVAPATLERVRKAIDELHYVPDERAGALRRGRNRSVGLMLASVVEPFFASLMRVVSHTLRQHGYTVLVADSEYESELELQTLKLFHGNRVSGLIIRPGYGSPNLDYLLRMRDHGTHIVEIDYHYPDSPFSWVMLDNPRCIREGVRYLHDLGHRRIAALGSYDPIINPEGRSRTFPQAMQELGLEVPDEYRRVIRLTEDDAYRLTHDLMRLDNPPTALFGLNGSSTLGAFRALQELGLRIPQDVSLLSFDDYTWMQVVRPQIDVFAQPVDDMGRLAARLVVSEVEQGGEPQIKHNVFPGELLKRGSCAAPRD
jgi:LacI family transcriptional regulator